MFGSEILDVCIGLVMIFLLLSLVCSSIKEALETVLKHRALDLHNGIKEMFNAPPGSSGGTGEAAAQNALTGEVAAQNAVTNAAAAVKRDLVAEFYNHPLINGLFAGSYQTAKAKDLPSYIPARTFALAVLDLVRRGAPEVHGQSAALAEPKAEQTGDDPAEPAVPNLRAAIASLGMSNLRGALLPLVYAAKNDRGTVLSHLEDWYNSAMDRVSGGYKRRTQQIIALVGLTIAVLMNVDTLAIARYLNTNQTARALLISHVSSQQPAGPTTTELTQPMRWLEQQGGIPLGWVFSKKQSIDFDRDWRRAPDSFGGWVLKIAGLLFTAFAISLGAPFWFDVLNKFMVVRSTVKPDEKSRTEKSKS